MAGKTFRTKERSIRAAHTTIHIGKYAIKLPLAISKALYRISRQHYFPKMRGGHKPPPRPDMQYIFVTWLLVTASVGMLYVMSHMVGELLIMAPFGATCVLVFGVPESPLAQPRNVIAGYLIATIISIFLSNVSADSWLVVSIAVSTTIAVMQFTGTLHPPAGAIPIAVTLTHSNALMILLPVIVGSIAIVAFGVIANNFAKGRHYPKYWW